MNVAKARQPRHALIETQVVLHRARAERKEPGVNAIVFLAEPHVVAHRFRFAEAGQARWLAPGEPTQTRCNACRLVDVDARRIGAADLKDQAFLNGQRTVAAEGFNGAAHALRRRCWPALTVRHHNPSRSALW